MVTSKYFKTDSRVILVGKKNEAGATSLLRRFAEIAESEGAVVVSVNFDDMSHDAYTVKYLRELLDGVASEVMGKAEVVILLDEVANFNTSLSDIMLDLISVWSGCGYFTFVCTGGESGLMRMFEGMADTKNFRLSRYDGGDFHLSDESGAIVTVEGCTP